MRASGTQQPGTRVFSNEAYKIGDLKRRLPTLVIANFFNSALGVFNTGNFNFRAVLKNLSEGIDIDISVAAVGLDVTTPIMPSQIPATAITMQLTPVKIFGDCPPTFLRPVFQDPTAIDYSNHPLAQDVPFGWDFHSVADEVYIDIVVNADLLVGTNLLGALVVQAAVEYDSSWPFPEAVKYQLAKVQLTPSGAPLRFDTRTIG